MAKKTSVYPISCEDAPATLENHPFYGIKLDDEQKNFRDAIWNKDKIIVFCNARAGTGKTMIATATANLLCQYGRYDGIVYIAAPTQEQKQGFLAGSLADKSEPYFEPLYQALTKLGTNLITCMADDITNQKNGTGYIQCLTHTFLRGCNFENKVVIIDEAQNFYIDELQKVLTRIHDNCKVIVIGHTGQVDLYKNPENSGFAAYLEYFSHDERTAVCNLTTNYRGWISNYADDIGEYLTKVDNNRLIE